LVASYWLLVAGNCRRVSREHEQRATNNESTSKQMPEFVFDPSVSSAVAVAPDQRIQLMHRYWMAANYLAVGKVSASNSAFSGSMMLKPETPSSGAVALRDAVLANLKAQPNSGIIDTRVDTVQFNNFTLPSSGFPSDKGCVWNGDMIYAYQTESWFINVKLKCNDKEIALKGNMPFTLTKNVGNQHQYDLTLMVPNTDKQNDDDLFAKGSADQDLFAAADGLSGQIIMKESAYVDVVTDGKTDKLPVDIDATGSFTATNIPLEAARSFAMVVGILSRTFFGA